MKRIIFIVILFVYTGTDAYAQEGTQVQDSVTSDEVEEVKDAKAIRKIEKAEKNAEKDALAKKRMVEKIEKTDKLGKSISSKKKSIAKNEKKIVKLEQKIIKGKSKDELSPLDVLDINQEIDKLKNEIVRAKEKLEKLVKKQ